MLEERIEERRNLSLFMHPFHKTKIKRMILKLALAHQSKCIEKVRGNLTRLSNKTLKVSILIGMQESLESI